MPLAGICAGGAGSTGVPTATFFDDFEPNVVGARAEGITAFQVRGVAQLTACLRKHGFMTGVTVQSAQ